jgi:fibronectin type 3 domain-containing protein
LLRARLFFGLFVFAVLALGGCGGKPDPSSAPRPHSVSLAWTASAAPVEGYNVYRADVSGGPYTKLNLTPIKAIEYKDNYVQAGHTYFYVVTAVDLKKTESRYSKEVWAQVPDK